MEQINEEREGEPRGAVVALGTAQAVLVGTALTLLAWKALDARTVTLAGLSIDRLSTLLGFLVATVGAVAFRFSVVYLAGEAGRLRFLGWLTFTVVTALVLMFANNLLLLFLAWTLTSTGLHMLLTHYADRMEALRPARKKFLISRLGDLALIATIILVWRNWGTLDLSILLAAVEADPTAGPVGVVGLLVALAALTKSAQFPFHSWLPETMDAPTPVSALMHAGIINAGGALLLRFAPLLVRVPEVLLLVTLVGTLTAMLGLVAMWAQVKVKRTLAWSTVGQMGFMMVQIGLAAFPAAALHVVTHGWYKAWSFLRTGDLPASASTRSTGVLVSLALLLGGTLAGSAALAPLAYLAEIDLLHAPGELALAALTALACGQVWVGLLGRGRQGVALALAVLAAALLPTAALGLYVGMTAYLSPVLGSASAPAGGLAWVGAVLPVAAMLGLAVFQAALPALARTSAGRMLYVHALHGWYFGAIADRLVDRLWDGKPETEGEVVHA